MRRFLIIVLILQTSCSSDSLKGTYKAFWYETLHELKIKNSQFNYKVEGHLGFYNIDGAYTILNDTIYLKTKQQPNKFLVYNNKCLIELESGYEFCKRTKDKWFNKQHLLNANRMDEYKLSYLPKFPKIELSEIFKYYETSGLVEKSPSKKYFNPDSKGIFVFYTLFHYSDNQIEELGSLVTHTYNKDDYGWAAEDKDQTFIELNLTSHRISIGQNIQVGREIGDFVPELGMPILKNDSIAIFAGSENLVCLTSLDNNKVKSIKYRTYNLDSRINEELIANIK